MHWSERENNSTRIGLIGFGFIGRTLYEYIDRHPGEYTIAFVSNRNIGTLKDVDKAIIKQDLRDIDSRDVDLIIEAAHSDITKNHGASFLAVADYLPLSTSALIDEGLRHELTKIASAHGTRLLLPHGAIVGLDSLVEWREQWKDIEIIFRKPPSAIDFSEIGSVVNKEIPEEVEYSGTVRELAHQFPRNVNAMVTCALATIGLDTCRASLIVDPTLTHLELEVRAFGYDGSQLNIHRQQPANGVSGSEMVASLMRSLKSSCNAYAALDFV